MSRAEALASALREALSDKIRETIVALGEVTIVIGGAYHLALARVLRDDARLDFAQLIDLAGIDYSSYGETGSDGPRFAVVMHLLSLRHNWRVRVRSLCADDELPGVSGYANVDLRQLVRTRSVRSVRHRLRGPSGPAAHPHRLWVHRPSVPQRISRPTGMSRCATTRSRSADHQPVTIETTRDHARVIREHLRAGSLADKVQPTFVRSAMKNVAGKPDDVCEHNG
jgi:hypothetical protein